MIIHGRLEAANQSEAYLFNRTLLHFRYLRNEMSTHPGWWKEERNDGSKEGVASAVERGTGTKSITNEPANPPEARVATAKKRAREGEGAKSVSASRYVEGSSSNGVVLESIVNVLRKGGS